MRRYFLLFSLFWSILGITFHPVLPVLPPISAGNSFDNASVVQKSVTASSLSQGTEDDIFPPVPIPSVPITSENIKQLKELARWGEGNLVDAKFSPDGKRIIAATRSQVQIYRIEPFQKEKSVNLNCPIEDQFPVGDGTRIIVRCIVDVYVLNLESGEIERTLDRAGVDLMWGKFLHGGNKVLGVPQQSAYLWTPSIQEYVLWDTASWEAKRIQLNRPFKRLFLSPDGKWIGGATEESVIFVWKSDDRPNTAIEISARGDFLGFSHHEEVMIGQWDQKMPGSHIIFWDITAQRENRRISVSAIIQAFSISADDALVAIFSRDMAVYIYTAENKLLYTLPFSFPIRYWLRSDKVEFSSNHRFLLILSTAERGQVARIWRLDDGGLIGTIAPVAVELMDYTEDEILISRWEGAYKREIESRNIRDGKVLYAFSPSSRLGAPEYISRNVEVSLDKQWIAYNRLIINTETQEIRLFSGKEGMFSPDGKFYGAYTVEYPNYPVNVIRLDDGKQIMSCEGIPLSFSHNSEVVFACGRLWELSTGRTLWSFNQTLANVRFSKDDSRVLGINIFPNALFFLDTKNGKVLAQSKMPAGTGYPEEGLILDPQGLILLAGPYYDRSIYVWNAKGNQIFPVFRPANVISKMGLIANGHILVAQDRDGVIHFLGIDEQKAANLEQSYAIATAVAMATPAPLYGPKSGEIDEKRWKESRNWIHASVNRKNYVIQVTLTNLAAKGEEWPWPFHLAFRQSNTEDYACILYFSTTGKWRFEIDAGGKWNRVADGTIPGYKRNTPFRVKLIVQDSYALLYLNENFMQAFDISENPKTGDVVLALPLGIRYQDFVILDGSNLSP